MKMAYYVTLTTHIQVESPYWIFDANYVITLKSRS